MSNSNTFVGANFGFGWLLCLREREIEKDRLTIKLNPETTGGNHDDCVIIVVVVTAVVFKN